MNREELIENFSKKPEKEIYYDYLLGQDVWYFRHFGNNSSEDYDAFKKFISINLSIPFNNISIVGSAKTRYSFSPEKNFSEFNDGSDFDLVIVSNKLFGSLWEAYRTIAKNQRVYQYSRICNNIFNGFVSIKENSENYSNPEIVSWQKNLLNFKTKLQVTFNIRHEVNYRIYSDWEAVEDYHLKGINKIKNLLDETN